MRKIVNFFSTAAIRGIAAAGGQYLNDGKITNISGVLAAMIPAADTVKKSAEARTWWASGIGTFLRSNKFAVTTGLELLEAHLEDKTYHTLDWVNLASGALVESLGGSQTYTKGTTIDWSAVTRDALIAAAGALIVGDKYGEDAGLSFLGRRLGNVAGGIYKTNLEIEEALAQQADDLAALVAALARRLLRRRRETAA